ncbi:MAG TPA: hypothetical protein ENO08_05945, partial [Candidatus Eisenbacteria bacterium]|nr:hypothetical protein [Candidatus Eisenbacteria bacterium]
MFRKKLSAKNIGLFMACLFLFFAVYSCTNDKMDIANPVEETETIELDPRITETGQMHNEIVLRFILEVVPRY